MPEMKNILLKTNRMRKALLKLISDICCFFGRKKILLNASEIDSEFLNNFDYIGDYKRVFPSQTRLNVTYTQTKSNSNKGKMDRRDIYAPPVNSFSVSSPGVCFSSTKALAKNIQMTKSFLNVFNIPHLTATNESGDQPENFVYVKKNNGYIENWFSAKKQWNKITLIECALKTNGPSSSYFNMHKLDNGEGKKPGPVILLDLYLS